MFATAVQLAELSLLGQFQLGLLFMEVLLFFSSIFLMLLILVQRGKGGGLTGALGGMGGQSAFGSKAGDAFTKITIITSMIWITLCMITIAAFNPPPRAAKAPDEPANAAGSMSGDTETGDTETEDTDTMPTDPESDDNADPSTPDNTTDGNDTEPGTPDDDGFQLNLDGPENTKQDSESGNADRSDDDSNSGN